MRISPAPGTLVSDGTALTLHLRLADPPWPPAAPSPPQRRRLRLHQPAAIPSVTRAPATSLASTAPLRSGDDRRGGRRRVDHLRGQRRAALGTNRLRPGILLGLPVRLRAQAKAPRRPVPAPPERGHGEWLTGVTLVPMPNVLGDLGRPPVDQPHNLSAAYPRDLNPHVSRGT